jgi:hypothetical protein
MTMFVLPETGLAALSDEALAALRTQGEAAFTGLGLTAESDEATVAEAERVVAAIRDIKAEQGARDSRRATAAALVAEMSVEPEPEPEPVVEAAAEPEAVVEASDEEPAAEPEAEDEAEDDAEDTADEDTVEVPSVEASAEETVTAAASTTPTQRAARNAPAVHIPKEKAVTVLTAAADVPGFATGATLDSLTDVATGVLARTRNFPKGRVGGDAGVFNRYGVASITMDLGDNVLSGDFAADQDVLDRVADESNLPGGSLVAAGGWCGPADTIIDMCERATRDGIFSLPEVGVPRGRVNIWNGVDFSTMLGTTLKPFTWVDGAPAQAGDKKACITVDCPTPHEYVLDAMGLCIKADILSNASFPEYTRHFISQALLAYEHWMGAQFVQKVKANLTGANHVTLVDQGSSSLTLDLIGLVIEAERQKYRLGRGQSMEVIAPAWLQANIRSDLARRNGVDMLSVTDAQISQFFAIRGASVQFVYGLSDLAVGATDPAAYPATADLLIYPSGTFVKGTLGVINLDAVYDSTGLAENTYTGLFFEEGAELIRRCFGGALVTVPICGSGRTGANDLLNCAGAAVAPKPATT